MNIAKKVIKKKVWCTTQFEGWHVWENAPEHNTYLRNSHRHIFHVKLEVAVDDSDRQVEFIEMGHALWQNLGTTIEAGTADAPVGKSCEMFAEEIANWALNSWLLYTPDEITVTVSEDGENGATVSIQYQEVK